MASRRWIKRTMTKKTPDPFTANRAQSLRQKQTRSEGLLWSILRAKQLCGLKFRRQHPIGPWVTDFACADRIWYAKCKGSEKAEAEIAAALPSLSLDPPRGRVKIDTMPSRGGE